MTVGLPDAGGGACCIGAAVYGPDRCTCWEPVHDLAQAVPDTAAATGVRPRMCPDCAYRPGSPERAGDPDAQEPPPPGGAPFHCHEGMRAITARIHRPTGVRVPAATIGGTPMEFDPPVVDGRPHLADGSPAPICAGWWAIDRHHLDQQLMEDR